jgi:hypothetical protein
MISIDLSLTVIFWGENSRDYWWIIDNYPAMRRTGDFPENSCIQIAGNGYAIQTYLLLTECEVHTVSYGLSFFHCLMAQPHSARAKKGGK